MFVTYFIVAAGSNLNECRKCVIPVVFVKIGNGMQSNTTVSLKVYLMAMLDYNYLSNIAIKFT